MNNSFSISRRGARDKVKAALATEVAAPANSPQHQLQAAVGYLITQIDALPESFNAVSVVANGDLTESGSQLHTAVMRGEKLDV
jgi:hypothetical protein